MQRLRKCENEKKGWRDRRATIKAFSKAIISMWFELGKTEKERKKEKKAKKIEIMK